MWKIFLLITLSASCSTPGKPGFEFVETAPLETSLDSADIADFADVWVLELEGAQRTIDLAHFYASDQPPSRLGPVIEAIEDAAARGVRVRFLADAGFAKTYPEILDRFDSLPGIEVRRYDMRAITGGVLHAKYMLIDGELLCAGSANFDWRSLEHIQELGALVRSPQVAAATQEVFELDWRLAGGEEPLAPDASWQWSERFPVVVRTSAGDELRVTPVFSPNSHLARQESWDLPHLVSWIDAARREVNIQLLTFRMSGRSGERFLELESALLRAVARGVSVRLLVADWGKRRGTIEGLQELQRLPGVEVRMATIPSASEGHIPFARVIHSKYMVVDDARTWIGSSNWEKGYFFDSRNVGVLVEGAACAERMRAYFQNVWDSAYAYAVDAEAKYEVPRIGE